MWHYHHHQPGQPATDIERLLTHLNTQATDFFAPDRSLLVARAPGRLDLMGGIADYSGSLVLEMPLAVATLAVIQPTNDPTITVCSTAASEISGQSIVSMPLNNLQATDQPLSYDEARRLLTSDSATSWAAYVIGVVVILQRERQLSLTSGLRIMIHCEVPIGKGVSSSAALEVAVMQALNAYYQLQLSGREMAILCQKVENLIVGAPCGVMDQMTSACGEDNSLLALLCQPAELQGSVPLPADVEIWGIDSGVRHAVVGADYGSVRVGAFMGYRMIADLRGYAITSHADTTLVIDDPDWQGYLANITPSLWESRYRDQIPLTIQGADFLARYGGTTDSITRIDPDRIYAVRQPTAHPIYEHHRVRLFRALLQDMSDSDEQLSLLGELMYQSHISYSACGLGSAGTDRLVELVREAGTAARLYGAKITGGGSGGTVAILARTHAEAQIQALATRYEHETGLKTTILRGSSPGAYAWGTGELRYS
ncbi:galactokinase [Dictyobacter formicarum]|uniref:Galactokinase n=1 Tax=Dictyobacter formicarum TaxID=2778368 RepID=A0ABQ3VTA8_9CHLR|nr:galactokinase family protein [Dictyobacter formicarum]GHO89040.1 galactokinase [Dictyobacter formicarum]